MITKKPRRQGTTFAPPPAQHGEHTPPERWTTAPVPQVTRVPRSTEPKWHVLYEALKTNSEIPMATVIPMDRKRPKLQMDALRRALKRRAVKEGFNLHLVQQGYSLFLWLSLPAVEDGGPDAS